jgi:hypothetical protein
MERQAVAQGEKVPNGNNRGHGHSARSTSTGHTLLELQGSIGNQALQRLIGSTYIQTKLQISTPGDPFEQEADRVADTVMRMTVPQATDKETGEEEKEETIATKPVVQRVPLAVREDDDEEKIATKLDLNAVVQRLCTECEEEQEQTEGQSGEMVHRKPAPDDDVEEQQIQPSGARDSDTQSNEISGLQYSCDEWRRASIASHGSNLFRTPIRRGLQPGTRAYGFTCGYNSPLHTGQSLHRGVQYCLWSRPVRARSSRRKAVTSA